MTRTRIFISHSCKDVEIADDVPFEDETDPRKQRLKYARHIRDEVKRLLETDFDVLLDRELLDPGDRWSIKLKRWLGECDGAVLLLSEDAIESKWVLQEATILTWRWYLRANFRLIPVRLGGLTDEALAAAGFGPLQISDIQAARVEGTVGFSRAEADALAARIAERFKDLATNESDAMGDWVDDVAAILSLLPENILFKTCGPLAIAPDDWAHFPDQARTVAHALLHAKLGSTSQALERIVTALSSTEAFVRLAEKLLPMWVDPAAAAALAENRNSGWHAYAINTDDDDVARDYLRRAWCCPPWLKNRHVLFDEPVGEGQADEVIARLHDAIVLALKIKSRDRDRLAGEVGRRAFFVLLGESVRMNEELCAAISADEALSTATVLQLAGRNFERTPDALKLLVRLVPELDEQRETDAYHDKRSIGELDPRGA